MTKKIAAILFVLLLVIVLSVVASAQQKRAIPINMDLTGTYITTGDGSGIFDVALKGSPGKAYARGVSVTGEPVEKGGLPANNQCVDKDGIVGMNVTTAQITIIFQDGSMLFGNGVDGGYVCFEPGFAYAPYAIDGGLGRYEGADGELAFELDTYAFGGPTGAVIAETGTGTGWFTLP